MNTQLQYAYNSRSKDPGAANRAQDVLAADQPGEVAKDLPHPGRFGFLARGHRDDRDGHRSAVVRRESLA